MSREVWICGPCESATMREYVQDYANMHELVQICANGKVWIWGPRENTRSISSPNANLHEFA